MGSGTSGYWVDVAANERATGGKDRAPLPRAFREASAQTRVWDSAFWVRDDCPKRMRKPLSFTRVNFFPDPSLQPEWAHNPLKTNLLYRWLLFYLLVPQATLAAQTNVLRKPSASFRGKKEKNLSAKLPRVSATLTRRAFPRISKNSFRTFTYIVMGEKKRYSTRPSARNKWKMAAAQMSQKPKPCNRHGNTVETSDEHWYWYKGELELSACVTQLVFSN